jgi:purine nucleosidase/pyrimidine-specific ribonucleoside hydrolase
MKPIPILLDVDAGVDDTLAIIFALLSPHLDVRAITTVAGNVPVRSCTRNVLLTLEILSSIAHSPPVAEGASKPLRRKLFTAKEVHGDDGIGGASQFYPSPTVQSTQCHAVELILQTVKREAHLTLVATGPLTNIALALKKDFPAMRSVREIVVMGGGFNGVHNTGPCAEFNFYVDPDAADRVMQSGLPIRLIPLNVTERCVLTPGDIRSFPRPSIRRYVQRVTKFYFDFHKRTEQINGGYVHDPLAVGAVLQPSILQTELGYVRVESEGTVTRGVSVFFPRLNVRKEAELPRWVKRALLHAPTVRVATRVDTNRFRKLFLASLSKIH